MEQTQTSTWVIWLVHYALMSHEAIFSVQAFKWKDKILRVAVCLSVNLLHRKIAERTICDLDILTMAASDGGFSSAAWTQVPPQGDLIVEGEEDSNANDAASVNSLSLHASDASTTAIDVSILNMAALENGLQPSYEDAEAVNDYERLGLFALVNDNEEGVEDINLRTDDVPQVSDNEEEHEDDNLPPDDVEDEVTSSPKVTARLQEIFGMGKDHRKLVVVFTGLTMLLMIFSINQHYRYANEIARLEQENARMKQEQEELRRLQSGWKQEEEEWMLADNCYVHAKLGDCATKYFQDVNSGFETFYEWGQAAWEAAASSLTQPDDEHDADVPKTASISAQALSEASHAFSHFLVHAQDTGSKLFSEISHGIQASLRDVSASAEETFNLIVEQTRDAVEDGTAFTRPKQ